MLEPFSLPFTSRILTPNWEEGSTLSILYSMNTVQISPTISEACGAGGRELGLPVMDVSISSAESNQWWDLTGHFLGNLYQKLQKG